MLLSDEQLKELGAVSMGERASLRALCKRVERCKQTYMSQVTLVFSCNDEYTQAHEGSPHNLQ